MPRAPVTAPAAVDGDAIRVRSEPVVQATIAVRARDAMRATAVVPRASTSGSRAAPLRACGGVNRSRRRRVATRTSAVRFCSSPPSALLQIVTSRPRS